jgi:hypothetical protein
MKKRYILLIIIIIFAIAAWFYACTGVVCAPTIEDRPNSDKSSLAPDALPAQKEGVITVTTPLPQSTVSSPVTIKGKAVGNWFFEASAPVDIVNWDGLIIGQGHVTVDEGYDWMTTDMVPFTGSVSYDATKLGAYKYGWIIMRKDNPSGEAKFDDSLEFKVLFP